MKRISTILPLYISLTFANSIGVASQPDPRPVFVDIAFLSDTECVSVNKKGQFHIWDLATGSRVRELFLGKHHWFASAVCFAFSPDARYVACGKWDGTIAILRLDQEKEVVSFRTPYGDGRLNDFSWSPNITWSPDGKVIAATDHKTVLHVWDARTGKENAELTLKQPIWQFALAPDGKSVLLGPRLRGDPNKKEDLRPQLVDLATGRVLHQFARKGNGVAFSPDGNLAAVFGKRLEVWGIRDKRQKVDIAVADLAESKLESESSVLYSITFSADSRKLITAGMGQRNQIVDVSSGKVVVRCGSGSSPTYFRAKMSPGGRRVVAYVNAGLMQWNAVSGEEISNLTGYTPLPSDKRAIRPLGFTPDNHHLLVNDVAGQAHLMDLSTGKVVRSFKDQSTAVVWAALTADGKQVVSENYAADSWDRKLVVWDVGSGKLITSALLKYPSDRFLLSRPFALSPDGKQALVSLAGRIRLVSLTDGKQISLHQPGEADPERALFSPDGRSAVTWRNGEIALWKVPAGQLLRTIPAGHLSSLTVSPDGKQLLTTGEKLALWDLASGKMSRVLAEEDANQFCSAAFSPDGGLALTGRWDGVIQLWDVKTGKVVRYFLGKGGSTAVMFVHFSSDGKLAATGGDGRVHVWDVGSGREIRQLTLPN